MTLLLAIIGHLVGDYLLQNDWLAAGKRKSSLVCLIHCLAWTGSVLVFAGWTDNFTAAWCLLVTHFIQDRTSIVAFWMDAIGQKSFRTGPCSPWSMIVVDNVWHIVTLWAVWRFVA